MNKRQSKKAVKEIDAAMLKIISIDWGVPVRYLTGEVKH